MTTILLGSSLDSWSLWAGIALILVGVWLGVDAGLRAVMSYACRRQTRRRLDAITRGQDR